MKKRMSFICGFLVGSILFGGGAACAAGIYAERSTQRVFIDGHLAELEAYLIEGHNYLQLREVAEAVGFNVYWNEQTRTVQIESDRPYTGTAPEESHAEIDPVCRNGVYTLEACKALRGAVLAGESTESVPMTQETHDAMLDVAAAIGSWPVYDLKSGAEGMFSFRARYPANYEAAEAYCRPFIESLSGETDRETVRQLAFFVCDRIDYDSTVFCSPRTALVSDAVSRGACMSYAYCMKFLCDLAGIPCVYVHSEEHQWNQVFLEGKWWDVDVSSTDVRPPNQREGLQVLREKDELQGTAYRQSEPQITELAKEILVPGSTH